VPAVPYGFQCGCIQGGSLELIIFGEEQIGDASLPGVLDDLVRIVRHTAGIALPFEIRQRLFQRSGEGLHYLIHRALV